MISKDIIQTVLKQYTRAGKFSAQKIRDYFNKNEPDFEKYLETSTYDDIRLLVERLGIPPSKEVVDGLSSIIVGGKIEGFLIHSIAQDKYWSHKYGLDTTGELKPEEKFQLFLDGKLDSSYYSYTLTKEEETDTNCYKKIALDNFKKHQEKLKIENDITAKRNLIKDEKPKNTPDKKTVTLSDDLME